VKITIKTPIKAHLSDYTQEELDKLKKVLTYEDGIVKHAIQRHHKNRYFKSNNRDGWLYTLEKLKKELHQTLVFEDSEGLYIRPGSISYLYGELEGFTEKDVVNEVFYPKGKAVPWTKVPKFEPYPYQKSSIEKLLAVKHGNVSLTTGAGKSLCILHICRTLGLKTVVVTPSASITDQLYREFTGYFGKKYVGKYGDGRKDIDKLFTLATGQALTRIERGSPEWDELSKSLVLLGDESHSLPAETMEKVCNGLLAESPYRFFFSATQTSNSGKDKLLQSIIGPTVERLTIKEATDGGFICPIEYRIVGVNSSNPNYQVSDVLDMKRVHFLRNINIANFIAKLANAEAERGKQTLVLVEETSQIAMLLPLLTAPTAIAHSENNKNRLEELKIEKADVEKAIEAFNTNKVKILVGTGCIGMGVNVYPTHHLCLWIGGASEIKIKQSVGRGVRLHSQNPWKDRCLQKDKTFVWDFDIRGIDVLDRHLADRISYYKESETEIKYIDLR